MKKKTHEEYVSELAEINPNVEVIEKYVDARTKIMHRCLIHNIEWKITPSNALKGQGCNECMKEKNRKRFVKSHDAYISQVKNINPGIIVLEQYVDAKTPILHLCTKHNVKWKAYPNNILKGQGCCECGKEKYHEKKCKSQDEYISELAVKNPTVEVIGEYKGANIAITHRCLIHDEYWEITPYDALLGHGCKRCHYEKIMDKLIKDHDIYVKELSEKNPNVEVVEKYIDGKTKIKHRCLIHDEYWYISPNNALKGCGCQKCLREKISQSLRLTKEEYIQKLQDINPSIVVLGEYQNIKTPILHKCLIHDYEWITSPAVTLQGCGCPECRSEKIAEKLTKNHEEYVAELELINPNIIVVDKYVNACTPILHRCLLDGNEWYITPSNALYGYGCPKCNMSKGEKSIEKWLIDHQIVYEIQKRFDGCCDIRTLPFDFYLPEHNLCIEYDGQQHYEPVNFGGISDEEANNNYQITVRHDNIKNEFCENNNISLLRIPFYKNPNEELNNFLFI